MLYRLLIGILVLDAVVLAVAVLLQAGKGGGLAASFGGAGSSPNSLLGSREAGNLLTKTSWWSGGIFLGVAFLLHVMAGSTRQSQSILDDEFRAQSAPTAPAGAPPSGATPTTPLQPITTPPAGRGGDTSKQP
jgi:preprotein translocase subunit SecG